MADLPIGSIVMFDGANPPVGWYDCDGSTHSGITTPNLIGRFPKGVPSGGTLGATGGSSTHTHTNLDTGYQTHGHAAASANSSVGSTPSVGNIWGGSTYSGVGQHQHLLSISALSSQDSHKHTVPNTASSSSLPPYIRLRYIMRCE
jgi:microcystin-dependent protein